MKICFATNNLHKLEEVRKAVEHSGVTIESLEEIGCQEELPETRDTLEGNAAQKAEYVFKHYKIPCFADDTGLEVPSIGGEPGVYSARYAGPQRSSDDNIALLLDKLKSASDRRARFKTVIALIGLSTVETTFFEGVVAGTIAPERSGAGGFGYDPVFVPAGHRRSFAQMTMDEKNQMSHRALAVAKLIAFLKAQTP